MGDGRRCGRSWQLVGTGRWALRTGERWEEVWQELAASRNWEVGPQNWWEMGGGVAGAGS